ncbi:hypothetical protein [Haladaptatus sp. NG-WS-4]
MRTDVLRNRYPQADGHWAVRFDDGEVIEQVRVKNTDLEEIAQQYAGGTALLEATTNYFYIYDMLSEYR